LSVITFEDEDRRVFKGVRTLIIDEVSFLKERELIKLDSIWWLQYYFCRGFSAE
jgi:thymidine kinase